MARAYGALDRTELSDEQKLQVALCRRQCWVRAYQLGGLSMLLSYAGTLIVASYVIKGLPRGSRYAVPLGGAIAGMSFGAYLGGKEGAPYMAAAIREHRAAGEAVSRGAASK